MVASALQPVIHYAPVSPSHRNRSLTLGSQIGCWFLKRQIADYLFERIDGDCESALLGLPRLTDTGNPHILSGPAIDYVRPVYENLAAQKAEDLISRVHQEQTNRVESLRDTIAVQGIGIEALDADLSDLNSRLEPFPELPEFSAPEIDGDFEDDLLRNETASELLKTINRLRSTIAGWAVIAALFTGLELVLCWMTLIELFGGSNQQSNFLLLISALVIGICLVYQAGLVRGSKSLGVRFIALCGLILPVAALSYLRAGIFTYDAEGSAAWLVGESVALGVVVSVPALVIAFVGDSAIARMRQATGELRDFLAKNQSLIVEATVTLKLSQARDEQRQSNGKLREIHRQESTRRIPQEIRKVEDELARRHGLVRQAMRGETTQCRKSLRAEVHLAAAQLARWHYEDLEATQ